jgi:hypothetical protein
MKVDKKIKVLEAATKVFAEKVKVGSFQAHGLFFWYILHCLIVHTDQNI